MVLYNLFSLLSDVAKYFLNSRSLVNVNADAPEESQADVLLGTVSELGRAEDVLSRHQVQQKQHCPARQVVLKF